MSFIFTHKILIISYIACHFTLYIFTFLLLIFNKKKSTPGNLTREDKFFLFNMLFSYKIVLFAIFITALIQIISSDSRLLYAAIAYISLCLFFRLGGRIKFLPSCEDNDKNIENKLEQYEINRHEALKYFSRKKNIKDMSSCINCGALFILQDAIDSLHNNIFTCKTCDTKMNFLEYIYKSIDKNMTKDMILGMHEKNENFEVFFDLIECPMCNKLTNIYTKVCLNCLSPRKKWLEPFYEGYGKIHDKIIDVLRPLESKPNTTFRVGVGTGSLRITTIWLPETPNIEFHIFVVYFGCVPL